MNIKPRQLRMFVHLAQTLSFKATADAFGVTQPTLSRTLQELEAECGVRLFDRTTRKVRLTRAGQDLLGIAARIADAFDEGLAELSQVARQRQRRIAVAALPTLASLLLPGPLAALHASDPQVLVRVRDVYANAAIDLLRGRQVDIALSSFGAIESDLSHDAVTQEGFALLASRRHFPRIDVAHWTASGIGGVPLIAMWRGTGTRDCVDAAFRRKGLTFRPYVELQHLSVIADLVRSGFGATILPLSSARMMRDAEMISMPMPDVPPRSIAIITRREYRPDTVTRQFLDWVRAGLQDLNDISLRARTVDAGDAARAGPAAADRPPPFPTASGDDP